MIYNEIGSAGPVANGCGAPETLRSVTSRFAPGDVAYSVPKAMLGIMETVAIKTIRIPSTSFTGQPVVLYVDTFNALWNEQDLTDRQTAISLAEEYLVTLIQQVQNLNTCPAT